MKELHMTDTFPLKWPDGIQRTRLEARESRGAWKKTQLQYRSRLEDELKKMGVTAAVITSNIQPNVREPRDPSVAVYFTRPPAEDDFSWQDTLGINNPDPKLEEIEERFRILMKQHHSDIPGGDLEISKKLNEARKRARAYVTGDYGKENQLCIPSDKYKEVRLNIAAVALAISYLRRLEDVGVPGILDRAFAGFRAELTEGIHVSVAS
jgi:hypothetical protein